MDNLAHEMCRDLNAFGSLIAKLMQLDESFEMTWVTGFSVGYIEGYNIKVTWQRRD
jgi:hypothetical protein